MHVNTPRNDQLLLQHIGVGINSYGLCALSYTAPTVWFKKKNLKTLFWNSFKTTRWLRHASSESLLGADTDYFNISGFASRF